jgi:DNA-directed RNA polymerase specialized sigma24 family protein
MRRQGLIDVEDQYHYSPGVVKSGLEVGLRYRAFDQVPSWPVSEDDDPGVRSPTDPAEGNNLQAIMLDVLRGFDGLSGADQGLLLRKHLDGLTLAEIAAELGEEAATVRRRHKRAVDRLIDRLGGERGRAADDVDGPRLGGRRPPGGDVY